MGLGTVNLALSTTMFSVLNNDKSLSSSSSSSPVIVKQSSSDGSESASWSSSSDVGSWDSCDHCVDGDPAISSRGGDGGRRKGSSSSSNWETMFTIASV